MSTLATVESRAVPSDMLRDFQQYQLLKRQHAESARQHAHTVDSRAAVVVPGIAGQYAMRHGMQYYRDLAGNVKQVGFCLLSLLLQLLLLCHSSVSC